jgi:hypothetical protein
MLNVLIVSKYVNFWDGVNFGNIFAEAQADIGMYHKWQFLLFFKTHFF